MLSRVPYKKAWATVLVTVIVLTAAGSAAQNSTPILRFAIDQDYFPQQESVGRVAEDFILAHKLSVTIIRTGIGWDDTNPRPGQYRWEFWSRVIASAKAAGIEIRPYYAYTPAWAGPAYNSPPRDDADFTRACGVMARTVGARVPSLEIWNEPDNTVFWTGAAKPYGQLLRGCAEAIRAAGKGPAVVLGGLVYLDSPWLAKSGARPPADYDIAAFHQYTETPWDPTTVEKIASPADYFGGYDRLSKRGAVPIWMDEGGASTDGSLGYSEESQASWIRRTVASLLDERGRPLNLFGLYQLRDPDPKFPRPIGDPVARKFFSHTGLFTVDGRPKLGAATYGDLVRLFDGHRPTPEAGVVYQIESGRLSADFRLHAVSLEDGRQVVTIWDRRASSSGVVRLKTRGTAAFLHQPDGGITKIAGFDGSHLPVPRLVAGAIPLLYEIR